MAADRRTAEPALATRMNLALAGLYLDRTRTADGLREFGAARQFDRTRADLLMFEAVAQSQLTGNNEAATVALRQAAASAAYSWGVSSDVALGSVAPYRDPTRRGDLDGDRVTDLAVYRPSNGTFYTLLSRSGFTTFSSLAWGASDDLPVRGDYDGDALPDVAGYRPSTGVWYIRTSTSGYGTFEAYQWGSPGDVPVPRDYDGDGTADVTAYRPSTGTW